MLYLPLDVCNMPASLKRPFMVAIAEPNKKHSKRANLHQTGDKLLFDQMMPSLLYIHLAMKTKIIDNLWHHYMPMILKN